MRIIIAVRYISVIILIIVIVIIIIIIIIIRRERTLLYRVQTPSNQRLVSIAAFIVAIGIIMITVNNIVISETVILAVCFQLKQLTKQPLAKFRHHH